MLKVSKSSWHYRLLEFKEKQVWGFDYPDTPSNLCSYFWEVVRSFFLLPLYWISIPLGWALGFRFSGRPEFPFRTMKYPRQLIYTSLAVWAATTAWVLAFPREPFMQIYEVVFLLGALGAIVYFVIEVLPELIGKAKHKVDGMSFAQMAKEVIRAKKKRMCPEIMVVD